MTKHDSISKIATIASIIGSLAVAILSQLIISEASPTPSLIYLYDPETGIIMIQNTGLVRATGVTIEIDPEHRILHVEAIPTHLQGEPIINYSSGTNGKSYYVNHMYPKDVLRFDLKFNKTSDKLPDKINVIIRSNEVVGNEQTSYFTNLITELQIIEYISIIVISFLLAKLVMTFLKIPNNPPG
jgi:hypothetical protein